MSGAMTGRIVVFGATGYTGRLVAERLAGRGRAPGAGGPLAGEAADAGGLPGRPGDRPRRRHALQLGVRAGRGGRRARLHRRPVHQVGRARRAGGDHRPCGGLHRLDRRAGLHPPRLPEPRADRQAGRCPAADRDGLRLRAGRAGGRAGARGGGRGRRARRRRLLRARDDHPERQHRHAGVAGGRLAGREPRLPRRRAAHRADRRARALVPGQGQGARRACRWAAPSTWRSRAPIRSCRRSTSTSAGSARSRGRCRRARWSARSPRGSRACARR